MAKSIKYTSHSTSDRSSDKSPVSLSQASELLLFAEKLQNTGLCVIRGRNVLREYLDMLYGYCHGTGISKQEGLRRQVETSSGCQTMLIKHVADSSIGFLHTEENFEDTQLRKIYQYIDAHPKWTPNHSLPTSIESAYDYKIVDVKIHTMSYTFFGYPDLCFGGPAMGCNHTTNAFMCVDTLYTKTNSTTQALWANAVATMFFLLGDIGDIRELAKNLSTSGIYILGGYAFHIVHTITSEITSFEFGGDQIVEIRPDSRGDIEFVCQPNYPRSEQLKGIDILYDIKKSKKTTDIWYAQTLLEMEQRIRDMKHIGLDPQLRIDTHFHETIQDIMQVASHTLERDFYAPTLESATGFISPYLAGYATGFVTPEHTSIEFGKLFPRGKSPTNPKFWYTKEESEIVPLTHLYEMAAAYVT